MKVYPTIIAFCLCAFAAVVVITAIALLSPIGWIIERKWFELCQFMAWVLVILALLCSGCEIIRTIQGLR